MAPECLWPSGFLPWVDMRGAKERSLNRSGFRLQLQGVISADKEARMAQRKCARDPTSRFML